MSEKRRTGETTRAIDRFVQDYFKNGFVYVYERNFENPQENKNLCKAAIKRFLKRMDSEHPLELLKVSETPKKVDGILCYIVVSRDRTVKRPDSFSDVLMVNSFNFI